MLARGLRCTAKVGLRSGIKADAADGRLVPSQPSEAGSLAALKL